MQAHAQILSEIKAILHGRAPLMDQSHQLSALAVQARDHDDLTGFKTVLATFSVLREAGAAESLRFSPGAAFEAMYAGVPQSLLIEHKASRERITLQANTPDQFAQSSLDGLDRANSSAASKQQGAKAATPPTAISKSVDSLLLTVKADISDVMDISRKIAGGIPRGAAIVTRWKGSDAFKQATSNPLIIPSLLARLGAEAEGGDAYSAAFLMFVLSETRQSSSLVPVWGKLREMARTSSVMDAVLKVVRAPDGQPSLQLLGDADKARETGDTASVRKLGRDAFFALKDKEANGWKVSLLPGSVPALRGKPAMSPS